MEAERAPAPHRLWEAGVDVVALAMESAPAGDIATRAALLDAVFREVAAVGWQRATVERICRRAGVRPATFHALFADKQACFVAAGQDFLDRMVAHMRAALREVEGWELRVRVGLGAFLGFMAGNPHAAQALLVEGVLVGREAVALRDHALRTFALFIGAGPDATAPGGGPSALVSEATIGGVYGIVARRVREGRVETLPELLSSLVYFLLAPVVGRPRAQQELLAAAS